MRRSAAPSSRSAAKRPRFLSPFLNSSIDIEENDIFNAPKIKCENSVPDKFEGVTSTTCEISTSNSSRSSEEILKILFEPTSEADTSTNIKTDSNISTVLPRDACSGTERNSLPSMVKHVNCDIKKCVDDPNVDSAESDPNIRYYNVLWCKRSAKKHKVWEGDGTLIVKTRSAVLKDTSGKIIDRGMGYKLKEIEDIEDGGKFFIGGKECEIQFEISPEVYKSLEKSVSPDSDDSATQNSSKKTNSLRKPNLKSQVPCEKENLPVKELILQPLLEHKDTDSALNLRNYINCTEEILKRLFETEPEEDKSIDEKLDACTLTVEPNNDNNLGTSSLMLPEIKNIDKNDLFVVRNYHDTDPSNLPPSIHCYSVLWCKRSAKKHKSWEGDGTLIITNRSAVLKNANGKEIDRGLGYKLKEIGAIQDGSKFFIGGKECQIQFEISQEESYEQVESVVSPTSNSSLSRKCPLKFKIPKLERMEPISDPLKDHLILPQPTLDQQLMYDKEKLPLIDVKVDKFLTKLLRPHQKEGIIFMYKCILGFQHEYGNGVILADEMGLGKTLQCIALIWTLYKQGPYGGSPIIKRVIIITPSSLVLNWKKEFNKWLGEKRLFVFPVDKKHSINDILKNSSAVLIISYEKFLRVAQQLSSIVFDLVVCDEGHRIKNLNIKISSAVNCLSTNRRILLTGTPIQNDLAEYFSIIDFVNPGALGTIQSFRRSFEKPILQFRDQECTEEEREIGEDRSQELNNIASSFMLRRTQEVINQYLPPKCEMVVFCFPTELQKTLYKLLLTTGFVWKLLAGGETIDGSQHLVYISILRKLCNHPALLYEDDEENYTLSCIQSAFPEFYQPSPRDSGKMKVLENILTSIHSHNKKEKIVIVSGFTQTLDLIEELCKKKKYQFLRLDGSTATSSRQDLVDVFNRSYTKYDTFLLSTRAGGAGFNLIGASRIVLYDIDWNPANDLQAMARIWRDGQKHSVYVYRLLTTGTIEEKIYQRQISKLCLSGSVLNKNTSEKLKFSRDELKDLFTLHEDTQCLTHDLTNCECLTENTEDNVEVKMSKNSKNIGMEELLNWKHISGPISEENTIDFSLASSGSDISFLLVNNVNSSSCKR